MTSARTSARCAAHPSRPAVDACPVCERARCDADRALAPGGGCTVCTGGDTAIPLDPVRRKALDRELLVRFYIHEHSVEDICADLNLSCNQFRLLKSRAKVRFGELGKRALARRAFSRFQGHQKFRSIA